MKWFHPLFESTIELCLGALERGALLPFGNGNTTSQSGHRPGFMVVYSHRYTMEPKATTAEHEEPSAGRKQIVLKQIQMLSV